MSSVFTILRLDVKLIKSETFILQNIFIINFSVLKFCVVGGDAIYTLLLPLEFRLVSRQ